MAANPIDVLKENLHAVQRRRKRLFTVRQGAFTLALLSALSILLGALQMVLQFALAGRLILFALWWLGTIAVGVWWVRGKQRLHLDEQRLAHYVEDHIPALEQRLITSMEADAAEDRGWSSQLVTRLWADTHEQLQTHDPAQVTSQRTVYPAAGAALLMMGALLLALCNWSPFSRASMQVMRPWSQSAEEIAAPVILTVHPGDMNVPRGSDVMVMATLENATPDKVELDIRSDAAGARRVAMTRAADDPTYVYVLTALQHDITYAVDIGVQRSSPYRITLVDLPRVERLALTYAYPPHTGMRDKTVDDQGDVIAPEGTRITLHATFNKPLHGATLQFGDGAALTLDLDGATATGSFLVATDTTYTLRLLDQQRMQHEHPYEYVIRAIADSPPVLTPVMPGGDSQVMALEEVAIAATAQDDYGLQQFALHYSVGSGDSREVSFLAAPRQQEALTVSGQTVLYLEDLAVQPGDLITYYLTAVDNNAARQGTATTSDIYFLEVRSTAEEFRRAPQLGGAGGAGGGAGGGGASSALVENQKQIIAATWKLLQQQTGLQRQTIAERSGVILEAQRHVMQRAQLSLKRLLERFSFADESYDRAVSALQEAVAQMATAADALSEQELQTALAAERQALHKLLKAQAESRKTMIQMARNRGTGGTGAAMPGEREDLRALFEMEMGRLENRYELPPSGGGPQQDAAVTDALEKLRQLAQRQARLQQRQMDLARRQQQMTAAQRKRHLQELRREQEALRQQAQALSQRMAQRASQESVRQWSDRQQQLAQAARQMQDAVHQLQQQQAANAAAESQRALDTLRAQELEMRRQRQATIASLLDDLQLTARDLQATEQKVLHDVEQLNQKQRDTKAATATPAAPELRRVLERKAHMVRQLDSAKTTLQRIGKEPLQTQPEIAMRALTTLRNLQAEALTQRIEESRERLQQGWLNQSMAVEKQIEQAVERLSTRLQALDHRTPDAQRQQAQQAAAEATRLRRELESLRQQIEALQQGNRPQQALGTGAQGDARHRLQQHLQRSRQWARELAQRGAHGAAWGGAARSIERQLTRREIEDFLSQPDLWQNLLQPLRELEAALRAEAADAQVEKRLFSDREQAVPTPYQQQVDDYYRELARQPGRP